jgi:protein O-GlcNAc transferase
MSRPSLPELRRALANSPPTAEAHLRLGTALLEAGAAREAERELRAAIDLDPKCAGAWVNLGGILFSRWDFGAAVEANRRAAAAAPALALAHFNQGIGHLHLGEPEKVVECLSKVVELEPQNGAAYHHLGIALAALGRALEAQLCAAYAGELGYRPSRESAAALERAAAAVEGG